MHPFRRITDSNSDFFSFLLPSSPCLAPARPAGPPAAPPRRPPRPPHQLPRQPVGGVPELTGHPAPLAWARLSSWSACGVATRPARRGSLPWPCVSTARPWAQTPRTASFTATAQQPTCASVSMPRPWMMPSKRESSTPNGPRWAGVRERERW